MPPLISSSNNNLQIKGEVNIPGDKSISHRSLIFAALANGISKIYGLLEGEDVLSTADALREMGVQITKNNDGSWEVNGSGISGLMEPKNILDMGNSGTSARLLMGLIASFNFTSKFTGDASLTKRPMKRIFDPISEIGAKIESTEGGFLPASITGAKDPLPLHYTMPVASAQVKSAIMLAAINILGTTTIIEPEKCRDHTEIMMKDLGLDIKTEIINLDNKEVNKISVTGGREFQGKEFVVPGDISSASFLIVAALITKGSDITISNVGLNPSRDGIIQTLKEMGGEIYLLNERLSSGEKVADIHVKYSHLKGIDIPASRAPSMIDEYPIISVAAAHADGVTKMNGLEELKVKESNRLGAIFNGLKSCGVEIEMGDDDLKVIGGISQPANLVQIKTNLDHRIAMSFLIMGFSINQGLEIDDASVINTSFPNFIELFKGFGAKF